MILSEFYRKIQITQKIECFFLKIFMYRGPRPVPAPPTHRPPSGPTRPAAVPHKKSAQPQILWVFAAADGGHQSRRHDPWSNALLH